MEYIQGILASNPLYADDAVVGVLLLCFLLSAFVLSDRKGFLKNMLKSFFIPREHVDDSVNTKSMFYMRIAMISVSFLSFSLLLFVYMVKGGGGSLDLSSWNILFLSFGCMVVFYLFKTIIYRMVNWVFFDKHRITVWQRSYSSWISLSAVPSYILSLLFVFADLGSHTMSILLFLWLFFAEICLLFRAFHIFSIKKYGGLQLFVYLCALELMPLLIVGKVLVLYV